MNMFFFFFSKVVCSSCWSFLFIGEELLVTLFPTCSEDTREPLRWNCSSESWDRSQILLKFFFVCFVKDELCTAHYFITSCWNKSLEPKEKAFVVLCYYSCHVVRWQKGEYPKDHSIAIVLHLDVLSWYQWPFLCIPFVAHDIKCVLFVHMFICGKLIEYFLVMRYFILQIFIASLNVTFFCLYGLVRIFACYVLSPYFWDQYLRSISHK